MDAPDSLPLLQAADSQYGGSVANLPMGPPASQFPMAQLGGASPGVAMDMPPGPDVKPPPGFLGPGAQEHHVFHAVVNAPPGEGLDEMEARQARMGLSFSPATAKLTWAPENVPPPSDPSLYLPYYELPLTPPGFTTRRGRIIFSVVGIVVVGLLIGLTVFVTTTEMPLHDLIGQIFLLYGVSIGSSLAIGFRMRRTLILYRERRRHDAEAVECIHSGQVLPVPKHAVCKFCKTHGVFWKPSVTCHRPSHIRVPPVMACIGHLTQEHRALMVMLLAPMS